MPPQEHTENAEEKPVIPTRVEPRVIKPYDGDIVISGISGRYPESDNVTEFKDNLLNKVNMVTTDNRRWEPGSSFEKKKVKISRFAAQEVNIPFFGKVGDSRFFY